jgi:hypothetical protein
MTNFTAKETAVLKALIAAYEHERGGWGTVYLDNADHGLSDRAFAGVAGSLTKKGVYNDLGDCFGEVKLNALDNPLDDMVKVSEHLEAAASTNAADYTKDQRDAYMEAALASGMERSKARRAFRAVHGSMYAK